MESFDAFDFLFAPENRPFAIALGIFGGLLLIEIVTLVIGIPMSAKVDAMLDLHGPDVHVPDLHGPDLHGPDLHAHDLYGLDHDSHAGLDVTHEPGIFGTAWDWLNAGRVPLLVLLMIMLTAFGSIGYMIGGIAHSLIGWLPTWIVGIAAFILMMPVTRKASLMVSKIVPRDESYAINAEGLVGRIGIIVTGPLKAGTIARVKVKDAHGNHHFPWVRTNKQDLNLEAGAHVLLVDRMGNDYLVIAADKTLID